MAATVELAPHNPYGLALKCPVMAAAGCFGYGVEYARIVDVARLGAIVTRSTTLRGRRAVRPPQLIETPAGVLVSGEWPDPGLERVLGRYAPVWAGWTTPVLLSVVGETAEEYRAVAAALEGVEGIAGLELNLAHQPEQAARIVAAVRATTLLPLMVKLPPPSGGLAGLTVLARAVVDAGADAITAIAAPRGMAANGHGELVTGGLSGPALRPLALAAVAELAAAVALPIVGCGGIASVEDARLFLAAGATAVQVGAALLADPLAAVRIGEALASG